jgi:hypothetical protein
MVFNATFNNISGYIVVVSFIGWGNRNTQRKASICRKSLSFHYEKYGFNYQRKQVGLSNTSFLTTERSSWQQMHLGLLYIYLCNQCLITTYVMCSIFRGVVDTSLSVTCNIIELNKGLLFIFLSHYFKHIFTTKFF